MHAHTCYHADACNEPWLLHPLPQDALVTQLNFRQRSLWRMRFQVQSADPPGGALLDAQQPPGVSSDGGIDGDGSEGESEGESCV